MPLSSAYYNSEVIRLKQQGGRRVLEDLLLDGDKENWELRKAVSRNVRDMSNRQVYITIKRQGYRFDNERARWLKTTAPAGKTEG